MGRFVAKLAGSAAVHAAHHVEQDEDPQREPDGARALYRRDVDHDDHHQERETLVRTGLRLVLEGREGIAVVGEAANGEEAVGSVRRFQPDLVLMDVRMPVMDGLEATRRIVKDGAGCRVVVLTTFDLDEYVYAAMAAGASGFLLKDVTGDQLEASIRLVAAGEALLAPSVTRRLIERYARPLGGEGGALSRLTPREKEVLKHLARGLSNAELAAELHLGEATVKTHIARVLAKLGVRDRVQAVIVAYESGIAGVRPWRRDPDIEGNSADRM